MAGNRERDYPDAQGQVAVRTRPKSASRSARQAPMTAQPQAGTVFTSKTVTITIAVSFALMAALAAIVVLSSLFIIPPQQAVQLPTPVPTVLPTAAPFDPSVGSPLPNNRLILDYGIAYSEIDHNGPASIHPFTFLPALEALGRAWTAADPKHPAKLGLDLVVNVADSCQEYVVETCSHDVQDSILQAYIDYCQQHNLYLFLDFQFGRSTVQNVVSHYMPYFERYSFVEPAIDTEFHFYQANYGIPSSDPGYIDSADINWTIQQMAQIPARYHVPRKVLVLHEWFVGAISDIQNVKDSPDVSVVLNTDGFGYPDNKASKYVALTQVAIQGGAAQYGGFKLFNVYADCPITQPGCSFDLPQWTPQDILNPRLIDPNPSDPQDITSLLKYPPLVISYE